MIIYVNIDKNTGNVTVNNDQNIFDSKKRIKTATSNELEFKLTSKQHFSIAYNEILLALIANQVGLKTPENKNKLSISIQKEWSGP